MVSLYKDPDGDKVFAVHNEALEAQSAPGHGRKDSSDMDALKQRIKQLQDELTKHDVCCIKYTYSHACMTCYPVTDAESMPYKP